MRIVMRIMVVLNNKENLMSHFYDINAPKKPTNLSVNSDLLQRSKKIKH